MLDILFVLSDAVVIMAVEEAVCHVCGFGREPDDKFCPGCGLRTDRVGFALGLAPSVTTGVVVAIAGVAASILLPVPTESGFTSSIERIVLSTTVPHFDVVFGLIGGWVATTTLRHRSITTALVSGLLVAVLYTGTISFLIAATNASGLTTGSRLVFAGAAAICGALLAAPFAAPLGRITRLGVLARNLPGGQYVATGLSALIGATVVLVLYGIAVAAIIVAIILAAFAVLGWVIRFFSSTGTGPSRELSASFSPLLPGQLSPNDLRFDEAGKRVEESKDQIDAFGNHSVKRTNAAGETTGESRPGSSEGVAEHFDIQGNKIGETRERSTPLGQVVEHFDAQGSKTGESVEQFGIFGHKHYVEVDVAGRKVGETIPVDPSPEEVGVPSSETKKDG